MASKSPSLASCSVSLLQVKYFETQAFVFHGVVAIIQGTFWETVHFQISKPRMTFIFITHLFQPSSALRRTFFLLRPNKLSHQRSSKREWHRSQQQRKKAVVSRSIETPEAVHSNPTLGTGLRAVRRADMANCLPQGN